MEANAQGRGVSPTQAVAETRPRRTVGVVAAQEQRSPAAAAQVETQCLEAWQPAGEERPEPAEPGEADGAQVRPGIFDAVALLGSRLEHAVESAAVEGCAEALAGGGRAVVVGAGGSFAAAVHIAGVLGEAGWWAGAQRPGQYVHRPVGVDLLVVVSYSGSSPDCAAAILAAQEIGCGEVVVCTGSAQPRLRALLRGGDLVCGWGASEAGELPGGGERGFISVAATCAPAAVWSAAASPDATGVLVGMLQRRWKRPGYRSIEAETLLGDETQVIEVLGTGYAEAAMADLESATSESLLPLAHLSDSKDVSHGRYLRVLRPESSVLTVLCGAATRYEMALMEAISESGARAETLVSTSSGQLGSLELLCEMQLVKAELSRARGIDISRPGVIPPAGEALYRWDGPLL